MRKVPVSEFTALWALAALLLCGLSQSPPARAQDTVPTPTAHFAAHQLRVQTIAFKSSLIGKELPYNVLLPVDYDQRASTRFPVLFLLHGLGGHYTDWLAKTHLAEYAKSYEMIVIMPEGNDAWYTDSATVPSDKYESYIMKELIPDVNARFRTVDSRSGRSIAGLSMGGYGALKFALKYPNQFAFDASMSGALDATTYTAKLVGDWPLISTSVAQAFGPEGSPGRSANDIFAMLRNYPAADLSKLPYIYLDCGTEDPLLRTNHAMDDLLLARHIPHEFRERPGVHDWEEWDAQIQGVLQIAADKMPSH